MKKTQPEEKRLWLAAIARLAQVFLEGEFSPETTTTMTMTTATTTTSIETEKEQALAAPADQPALTLSSLLSAFGVR